MHYFEVSARAGDNVADMMNSLITQVYEAKVKPQLLAENDRFYGSQP